ncbi:MAG: hypothetical protein EU547_04315 [Promethearchaeota archaeon]|nr:MAG: hypothetical protein EU547_04315 [Candidatus Lokiarchaeota archaeon]
MTDKSEIRKIPTSLRGIETILRFLKKVKGELQSIRNIHTSTGISMRVVKNILLQLEKFGQVERVVEKNKVIPKWKITEFGLKVLEKANGKQEDFQYVSREEELIKDIAIPDNIEEIKRKIETIRTIIQSKIKSFQFNISKSLGIILNRNNPLFEDLLGFILKRIKYIKDRIKNLPIDLLSKEKLKKLGEKETKISLKEAEIIFQESFFIYSIAENELDYILEINANLSQLLENGAFTRGFSIAQDLRDEIRFLTTLTNKLETIKRDHHIFSEEELKKISKNKIDVELVERFVQFKPEKNVRRKAIEELILDIYGKIKQGDIKLKDHNEDLKENLPLYALYQLILDESGGLVFEIEELEDVINSLADKGIIPGIKVIQEDEDHFLKLVQFKAYDINEEEKSLIIAANRLKKFSLPIIVEETGLDIDKIRNLLSHLTQIGILKHSSSYLHGDQWYIVS